MTKLFTIDEVSDRPHLCYWRLEFPRMRHLWNAWHIRNVERALSVATHSLECDARAEYGRFHILRDAMDHAFIAWYLANIKFDEWIFLDLSTFYVSAPEKLAEKVELAAHFLRPLGERIGEEHPDAIDTVRGAAMALIESARHPPANRKEPPKNLPHSYIASDVPGQFKVGSWIHTGRYRPARIVAVQCHSPFGLHLSYGDEEDEEFVPSQSQWRHVSPPDTLKSLRQVFSAGDWVRHERLGDVRVVEVFNTSVVLDVSGRHVKLIPYFACLTISRTDEPAPTDGRPITERFPLGTWVLVGEVGEGVVLDAEEDTIAGKPAEMLTVLRHDDAVSRYKIIEPRSRRISKEWNSEVVAWRLPCPRFDFSPSWHRRARLFWLLHVRGGYHPDAGTPCTCCGYPNIAESEFISVFVNRCILCGWSSDCWSESEADDERPLVEPCFPEGRKTNGGYSLTEARHNFVAHGHMFRPDDPATEVMEELASERESLRRLFDGLLEASEYDDDLWYDIYHLGLDIGGPLEALNGPCEY